MRLSKRERFLIGLLLLIAIWALAFRFLLAPGYSSILYTKQAIDEMENEKAVMDLYLDRYPDMEDQIRGMGTGSCKEDFFYQNIEDVFIDRKLQRIADGAGVRIGRMSIGEPHIVELADSESFGDQPLMERTVTMEVESRDVKGVMEFADAIYREDKSIWVSFVDLKRESDTGTFSEANVAPMKGIVEVKFYYEETR